MMKILVCLGEINLKNVNKYFGILNLSLKIGNDVEVVYVSDGIDENIKYILPKEIKKTYVLKKRSLSSKRLATKYMELIKENDIDLVIMSNQIKDFETAPYLASFLNWDYAANVFDLKELDDKIQTKRFLYGTRATEEGSYKNKELVITTSISSNFKEKKINNTTKYKIIDNILEEEEYEKISTEEKKKNHYNLEQAKIVIGVGKGLAGIENLKIIKKLAELLNAEIGASRSAIDNGWMDENTKIGQTGKIIKPDLYIALGISGAMQHVVGVKQAQHIISVNNNPNAEFFRDSDLGIVMDMFKVVDKLIEKLSK